MLDVVDTPNWGGVHVFSIRNLDQAIELKVS